MAHRFGWIDIALAALFFVLGIGYWEYLRPVAIAPGPVDADTPGVELSDREYIRFAKTTSEAQAFLRKYPQARIQVERSGRLAVDFWVAPTGATHMDYLRLRVFINPRTNHPIQRFIICAGRLVQHDLLDFLATEQCLQSR